MLAGYPSRRISTVMMPEQAPAVLIQIPNNENVDAEHDKTNEGRMTAKVVDLDRDEKGRFADRQPAGPGNPENEAHPFNDREETIPQQPGGGHEHFGLRELADLPGKMRPDLLSGLSLSTRSSPWVFGWEIVVRESVGRDGQSHKQSPFEQLYDDDSIQRRRPLAGRSRFGPGSAHGRRTG